MRKLLIALLLMAPLTTVAQESESSTGPLFMKDLVDDGDFFAPWGIGIDFFTMDQDYDIKSMELNVPALGGDIDIDPSQVQVTNKLQHYDLKLDAWITPFLNVYGLIGRVDADTVVDLGSVVVPGLGSLPALQVAHLDLEALRHDLDDRRDADGLVRQGAQRLLREFNRDRRDQRLAHRVQFDKCALQLADVRFDSARHESDHILRDLDTAELGFLSQDRHARFEARPVQQRYKTRVEPTDETLLETRYL